MSKKRKKNKVDIISEYPIEQLYSKFKNHNRLKVFAKKGTKCVCCHAEGTRLVRRKINYKNGKFDEHIDLYTKDLILMTVDHMLPKSKKGGESLRNKQPMCCICNETKSSKYTPILGRFSWFYRLEYLINKYLERNPKVKAKLNKYLYKIKSFDKFEKAFENAYSISNLISYSQEPNYVEIKVSKSRSYKKRKKKKKKVNKKAIFVDN